MPADQSVDQLLKRCSREPIRSPSSIQPWGTLVVYRAEDGRIVGCGANAAGMLGLDADPLDESAASLPGLDTGADSGSTGCEPSRWERGDGSLFRVRTWRQAGLVYVEYLPEAPPSQDELMQRQDQLESLTEIAVTDRLFDLAVGHLRALTGFEHVMVYRFRSSGDGEVVAETSSERLRTYLGHRFPATDIPSQARELYLEERFRIIPDVGYEPVDIHGGMNGQLDLSHARLRSVSPVHLQYLKNMGVAASFSVSIIVEGRLWGLVAAHHADPRYLTSSVQRSARLYGRQLSSQLELLLRRDRQEFLKDWPGVFDLSARVAGHERGLAEQLDRDADEWMEMMEAEGLVLHTAGNVYSWGAVPEEKELQRLLDWLGGLEVESVWFTTQLSTTYPHEWSPTETASGVLAVGFPWGRRMLVWLRPELAREVAWGGNPEKPAYIDESGDGEAAPSLSPRSSFDSWVETRRGEAEEWGQARVEAAQQLREELFKAQLLVAEREKRQQWREAARTDDLTGLLTHGAFREELGEWTDQKGRNVALLYIDLDGFKAVNDTLGHPVGDRLLKAVSRRIRRGCREDDLIGRVGGDEFAVAVSPVDAPADIRAIAERLVSELGRSFSIDDQTVDISASVGLAITGDRIRTADDLLTAADDRMYEAKELGGNRVVTGGEPH